jgi:hypothetical protein
MRIPRQREFWTMTLTVFVAPRSFPSDSIFMSDDCDSCADIPRTYKIRSAAIINANVGNAA